MADQNADSEGVIWRDMGDPAEPKHPCAACPFRDGWPFLVSSCFWNGCAQTTSSGAQ